MPRPNHVQQQVWNEDDDDDDFDDDYEHAAERIADAAAPDLASSLRWILIIAVFLLGWFVFPEKKDESRFSRLESCLLQL